MRGVFLLKTIFGKQALAPVISIFRSTGVRLDSLELSNGTAIGRVSVNKPLVAGHFGIVPLYKMYGMSLLALQAKLWLTDWERKHHFLAVSTAEMDVFYPTSSGKELNIEVELSDQHHANISGWWRQRKMWQLKLEFSVVPLEEVTEHYEATSSRRGKPCDKTLAVADANKINRVIPHSMGVIGKIDYILFCDETICLSSRKVTPQDCLVLPGGMMVMAPYTYPELVGQTGCYLELSKPENNGKKLIFVGSQVGNINDPFVFYDDRLYGEVANDPNESSLPVAKALLRDRSETLYSLRFSYAMR